LTNAANLQYKLVFSASDNISTVATAEANGTTVMDWTANTLVATKSSLVKNTTYYFNVIVKDAAGNKTGYTKIAQTTETMCGGTGTSGDPYQICTLGDLHSMRDYLSSFFILNNDIDATPTATWNSGLGWDPVGDGSISFTGALNGSSKVIRGLTINRPTATYVGLFGNVGSGNVFEKIGLQDVSILGGQGSTGALMGSFANYSAPILRYAYSTGTIRATPTGWGNGVGGLIGSMSGVNTTYSFSTASVTALTGATGDAGGLFGFMNGGVGVSYSYATGKVVADKNAGGLVGGVYGNISYSYATGDVVATATGGQAGGLGTWSNTTSISYSSASGNVYVGSTTGMVGGLLAANQGAVSYSNANGHVQGGNYSGGLIAGVYANLSYSLATGKNLSTTGTRGAGAGLISGGTLTKNYAHDWGNGRTCTSTTTDANCNLVTTGTVKPFAFRFSPELEYVQMKYQEATSIPMRKISSSDKAAYRIWGSCTVHGATINIASTDGSTTLNTTTTCSAFSWEKTLNLSTLADGAVTITADQAGASTKTISLTKETSYCDGNPTNGDFAAGDGSSGSPYLICTTAQFDKLRIYTAAGNYFRLRNNLDLSSGFSGPIGDDTAGNCTSRFCGIVQGNGHVLRNLYLNSPTATYTAVFGYIADTGSKIENMGLENMNMIGGRYTATLVAMSNSLNLQNIYSQGQLTRVGPAASGGVGGLVGYGLGSVTVNGSLANVHIISYAAGVTDTGGMVGYVSSVTTFNISRNEAIGSVIFSGVSTQRSGAFAGGVESAQTFSSNISRGHVIGTSVSVRTGAFLGYLMSGTVTDSLATGSVLSDKAAGSFAGLAEGGTMQRSSAQGHSITGSASGVGGFVGSLNNNSSIQLTNVVSTGYTYSTSSHGALAGTIGNFSGNMINNSFYWLHTDVASSCIGSDLNAADADVCNDAAYGLDYSLYSNFTSQTAVYTNWDFTNTWKLVNLAHYIENISCLKNTFAVT
ncbi:MAG: hypothetical protein NTV34_17185, partial [Proteobacteria bacterium]|nr:hypothetical protein [Pseudomonadota bacterium]